MPDNNTARRRLRSGYWIFRGTALSFTVTKFSFDGGNAVCAVDWTMGKLCYQIYGVKCINLSELDQDSVSALRVTDAFLDLETFKLRNKQIIRLIDYDLNIVIYFSAYSHSTGFEIEPFSTLNADAQRMLEKTRPVIGPETVITTQSTATEKAEAKPDSKKEESSSFISLIFIMVLAYLFWSFFIKPCLNKS